MLENKDVQYSDFDTWFKKDKPALGESNPFINLPEAAQRWMVWNAIEGRRSSWLQ